MRTKQSEIQKCTSSTPKENSKQFNATVELGRKLVEELGLEPSCNTLGCWMAHYVSELIIKAEQAVGDDKAIAEKKCFDAILDLWKHRAEFPNDSYPLHELKPFLRAIHSLDPNDDTPRYYRPIWQQLQEEEKENDEIKEWVELADGIDRTARILIENCFASAAQHISDKPKTWISLVEEAEFELTPEQLIINFLSSENDPTDKDESIEERNEEIENLIGRLEAFSIRAKRYADALKDKLEKM